MTTTPSPALERDIQKTIMAYLKARPDSFTLKLAAGPYSTPGVPDVLHVEGGHAYFFEVKRPGGKPTPLQAGMIDNLRQAGATAKVVYSLEDVTEEVE